MAGINKYDVPAQDRYIDTYVDLPYAELMSTIGARQAQLDKAQDMLSKTYEDTQNLRYIPGTKNEEYVKDYISNVNSLVDKYYTSDMTNPIVKQQLRREFNNITDKTKLQNIQTNYANWMANNQIRQKQIAEGTYSPYLDEDPANNPEFGANDEIYNFTTPRFESYIPEAQSFWSNVKPSILKDPKTGEYIHTPEGYNIEGYDETSNRAYAESNWGTFAETPTGRAWIKHELGARGLEDTDVNRQEIATELLLNMQPTGTSLTGSRLPVEGKQGKRGSTVPVDREWWIRQGAVNQKNDPRNIKQVIAKEQEEYKQNLTDLSLIEDNLNKLIEDNINENDVRYATLLEAKNKIENDISRYEQTESEINKKTEEIIDRKSNMVMNEFVPKLLKTFGIEDNDEAAKRLKPLIKNMTSEFREEGFVSGIKQLGVEAGALSVKANATGIAAIPYIGQLVRNQFHREINKLGILSKNDRIELKRSIDKAVEDVQSLNNPTFTELVSAVYKTVKNYYKETKVTWGKDTYESIVSKSFVYQMEQLDEDLDRIEKDTQSAADEARQEIYNYNISDVWAKPLNYTMESGQPIITDSDGQKHFSQFAKFGQAVKLSPSSYIIEDISDGNRIKKDKDFNTKLQNVMAKYEPLPGTINPRIDKEGNIHVILPYQISSPTAEGDPIKKFDVTLNDDATIDGLADDYYAAQYYDTYVRLRYRNLHKEIEIHANSDKGHDYTLYMATEDGYPEPVSIRAKRVGSQYIIESDKDPNQPAKEYAPDGSGMFRELRFDTKEELENWLYVKQTNFLFGNN